MFASLSCLLFLCFLGFFTTWLFGACDSSDLSASFCFFFFLIFFFVAASSPFSSCSFDSSSSSFSGSASSTGGGCICSSRFSGAVFVYSSVIPLISASAWAFSSSVISSFASFFCWFLVSSCGWSSNTPFVVVKVFSKNLLLVAFAGGGRSTLTCFFFSMLILT